MTQSERLQVTKTLNEAQQGEVKQLVVLCDQTIHIPNEASQLECVAKLMSWANSPEKFTQLVDIWNTLFPKRAFVFQAAPSDGLNFYLNYLQETNRLVAPRYILPTLGNPTIPLEEIYTSVVAERGDPNTDVLPYLISREPRAVLRGQPGSGKSTLVRFLVSRFAKAYREQANAVVIQERDYGKARLPIPVRLIDYLSALDQHHGLSLAEFLSTAPNFRGLQKTEVLTSLFQESIEKGEVLVILQGLHEVSYSPKYSQIRAEIENFASHLGLENRLLITSRDHKQRGLLNGFAPYILREMTECQMERFVERGIAHYASYASTSNRLSADAVLRKIETLQQKIKNNPSIRQLAQNPLFLHILIQMHWTEKPLPERRVELYDHINLLLFENWQPTYATPPNPPITEEEAQTLLGMLALQQYKRGARGTLRAEEVQDRLCEKLADLRDTTPGSVRNHVVRFLQDVTTATGILQLEDVGQYCFLQSSFEEYFTARELLFNRVKTLRRLYQRRHISYWREPLLLALAKASSERLTELVRTGILARGEQAQALSYWPSTYNTLLQRDLLLAAECLGNCKEIEIPLAQEVAHELVGLYLDYTSRARYAPLCDRILTTLPQLGRNAVGLEMIPLLLKGLESRDENERERAAIALGHLGLASTDIVMALERHTCPPQEPVGEYVFASPSAEPKGGVEYTARVQMSAAEALWRLGEPEAKVLPILLTHLKSPLASTRIRAIEALGVKGDTSVPLRLPEALKDSEVHVRVTAVLVLRRCQGVLPSMPTILMEALQEEDREVTGRAAHALKHFETSPEEVIKPLLEAVSEPNSGVQAAAAMALGHLGVPHPEVIQALGEAIDSPSPFVQDRAIQALGHLKVATPAELNPAVLQALQHALFSGDEAIGLHSAEALGVLTGPSASIVQRLLAALQSEEVALYAGGVIALSRLITHSITLRSQLRLVAEKYIGYNLSSEPASVEGEDESPNISDALVINLLESASDRLDIPTRMEAWETLRERVLTELQRTPADSDTLIAPKAMEALHYVLLKELERATNSQEEAVRNIAWETLWTVMQG